jgi:hypothetical protein
MSFIRFKLSIGLGLLLASATVAHAVPIALSLEQAAPGTLGPQSTSAPCIIAGTMCQNPAGFDFTDFSQGGNVPAFNEDSPTYTVSQFPFLTFDVAIDVNTTGQVGTETLQSFSVFVDGVEIYNFTGPQLIGTAVNAGNGFGDWRLTSIDLSSFASTALVSFNAVWDGNEAGAESFFLVQTTPPPPVTEPGTLMLLGLGLLVIGISRSWRPKARR